MSAIRHDGLPDYDPLPGESAKAYAAFQRFYLMEPETRTILAAYQSSLKTAKPGLKSAPAHWRQWASTYRWHERALTWDAQVSDQRRRLFLHQSAEDKMQRISVMVAI